MYAQSYGENPQKSNIFAQISNFRRNRAGKLSETEVGRIASMRTDKSNADEAKMFLNALIIGCTLVTMYLAVVYYQDAFKNTMDPSAGEILSYVLSVVVEIAKIKLFIRVARAILFGWMWQDFPSFGYWLLVGAVAAGSYYWSVKVSTDGLARYSTQHADETMAKGDLTAEINAAAASVDAMILQESKARDAATSNKWKGNIVFTSSKSAAKSSATIENLMKQRETIVKQVTADYAESKGKRTEKIGAFAYFINRFGGYMELVCFLCLLGIAFADWKLVSLAKRTGQAPAPEPDPYPTEEIRPNNTQTTGTPRSDASNTNQGQTTHNLSTRTPLFTDEENRIRANASRANPVAQSGTSGTGNNVVFGPDEILELQRTRLQKEVNNIQKGNGSLSKITARVNNQLLIATRAFQSSENPPSRAVSEKFRMVFDDLIAVRKQSNLQSLPNELYLSIALWEAIYKNRAYTLNDYHAETSQNIAA